MELIKCVGVGDSGIGLSGLLLGGLFDRLDLHDLVSGIVAFSYKVN